MDFILEEMDRANADGVDFVPIWFDEKLPPPIICSYTREEYERIKAYPKSNRIYWKIIKWFKKTSQNKQRKRIM